MEAEFQQTIEMNNLYCYTDRFGNEYISLDPKCGDALLSQIHDKMELDYLCIKFPYVPLVLDKKTGMMMPSNGDYSARLSNFYHIAKAMNEDAYVKQNGEFRKPYIAGQNVIGLEENKKKVREFEQKRAEEVYKERPDLVIVDPLGNPDCLVIRKTKYPVMPMHPQPQYAIERVQAAKEGRPFMRLTEEGLQYYKEKKARENSMVKQTTANYNPDLFATVYKNPEGAVAVPPKFVSNDKQQHMIMPNNQIAKSQEVPVMEQTGTVPYQMIEHPQEQNECSMINGYDLSPQPQEQYVDFDKVRAEILTPDENMKEVPPPDWSKEIYVAPNQIPPGWHPNQMQASNPSMPNYNGVSFGRFNMPGYNYGVRDLNRLPFDVPNYSQNQRPGFAMSFEDQLHANFKEAYERRDEYCKQAQKRAADINRQVKKENPTLIERSNIDFSNPEQLALAQQRARAAAFGQIPSNPYNPMMSNQPGYGNMPYPQQNAPYWGNPAVSNPMMNNMGNPNIIRSQQPPYQIPQSPYGMNNPFGNVVNPAYMNPYGGMGGTWYGGNNTPWQSSYGSVSPSTSVEFIRPTQEEKTAGRFHIRTSRELMTGKKKSEYELEMERKSAENMQREKEEREGKRPRFVAKVIRVVQTISSNGEVLDEVPVEEYKEKKKKEALETNHSTSNDIGARIEFLKNKLKRITGEKYLDNPKPTQLLPKRFFERAYKLIVDIEIYDRARSLAMLESLYDRNIKAYDVKLYFKSCRRVLRDYIDQERKHPELDFRVPMEFRHVPVSLPLNGVRTFVSYKPPKKEYFTLNDGKKIVFYYDQPRLWGSEIPKNEWLVFLAQARYFRDMDIKSEKIEEMVKEEERKQDLENARMTQGQYGYGFGYGMYEWKRRQYLQQQQHDFYKFAFQSTFDDDEFEDWWNHKPPGTRTWNNEETLREQRLDQIEQSRLQQEKQIGDLIEYAFGPNNHTRQNMANAWNARVNAIYQDVTGGAFDGAKSLADIMGGLGYASERVDEQRIVRKQQQNTQMPINEYQLHKDLLKFANRTDYGPNSHPMMNPNVTPGYADPKYGLPPGSIDFSTVDGFEERKQRFYDYCNTKGKLSMHLKPIYK